MKIKIICVGSPPQSWIKLGCEDYLKRFPKEYDITLIHIPAIKFKKNTSIQSVLEQEKKKIMQTLPANPLLITLNITGKQYNSVQLSRELKHWTTLNKTVYLLIGSAEGLCSSFSQIAYSNWSLSQLTFPHQLVKILLLEQLYRAVSILKNHPYHRA